MGKIHAFNSDTVYTDGAFMKAQNKRFLSDQKLRDRQKLVDKNVFIANQNMKGLIRDYQKKFRIRDDDLLPYENFDTRNNENYYKDQIEDYRQKVLGQKKIDLNEKKDEEFDKADPYHYAHA